ncbi:unnamed protein product [Clonostachys rosea]|uniref:F-box domain-containing protein n=1 Tax=Bionectria ochroleuca TaxID=29856 RepID=A0ABY6UJJ7_BIOOC|nr:unnamed protein product [Clonostachys rosea]
MKRFLAEFDTKLHLKLRPFQDSALTEASQKVAVSTVEPATEHPEPPVETAKPVIQHHTLPINALGSDGDTCGLAKLIDQPNPGAAVCDSRLELLPPEIRLRILSFLDLPQLKAIVHASPVFHEQYVLDRMSILARAFEATLGILVMDAYAVHLCRARAQIAQDIHPQFIQSYAEGFSWNSVRVSENLAQDEIFAITAFYLQHVEPFEQPFISWLDEGIIEVRGFNSSHNFKDCVTETDLMRLRRSLYRFQLLCQIEDPTRNRNPNHESHLVRADTKDFIDLLPPWQFEELISACEFFDSVTRRASEITRRDNLRLHHEEGSPCLRPRGIRYYRAKKQRDTC